MGATERDVRDGGRESCNQEGQLNGWASFLVDKVKREQQQRQQKQKKALFVESQRISKQSVSRNANSAPMCKFELKPSILNRVVPKVLLNNLTK